MKYLKVRWLHSDPNDPIWLYSEIDSNRWEIRKVELFADGRAAFAGPDRASEDPRCLLSIEPLPDSREIASDPQFLVTEISKSEFEEVWETNAMQIAGVS